MTPYSKTTHILIYFIILLILNYIDARVKVIYVPMGFYASNHANKLTKIINELENKGYQYINSNAFNSITYLYFRFDNNQSCYNCFTDLETIDNDKQENVLQIFYLSFVLLVAVYVIYISLFYK